MSKPAILATAIGSCFVLLAAAGFALEGPARWLVWWVSLACLVASSAYALNRPDLLGKRDGRLVWWRVLPVLPYLAAFWVASAIRAWRRGFEPWNEVSPGLYVGKRLPAEALPPGVDLVVDLTGEWWAPASVRRLGGYRSLPVLDGSYPPDDTEFLEIIDEIASSPGGVYIHCEEGKGRAPTAAAVALLARGVVQEPDAALEIVRKGRPATKPTSSDLRFIERMASRVSRGPGRPDSSERSD